MLVPLIEDRAARRAARQRVLFPSNAVIDTGIDLKRRPPHPKITAHQAPEFDDTALQRALLQTKAIIAILNAYAQNDTLENFRPSIRTIQRVVARHYGLTLVDLISDRRTARLVRPRQIAMYLAKTLTLRSLPEIGRRFGGRDHTTILHGVLKIEALINVDGDFAEEIETIKRKIFGGVE